METRMIFPEIGLYICSFLVSYFLNWLFCFAAGRYLHSRNWVEPDFNIKRHFSGSVFWMLFVGILRLLFSFRQIDSVMMAHINTALEAFFIAFLTWSVSRLIDLLKISFFSRWEIGPADSVRERKIRTQVQYVEKIILLTLYFVAIALILMNFEGVRRIGGSLIASAGLAGVVVGFAAQRSLANLLAGFQIAFTQPIRIDDVVIVEGEWGRVEEITFTYVVIRIWDRRILIVPITYFLEKPFQNWTRTSSDLLGTIFLYVDYSMPLAPLREEFKRFIAKNPLWDRKEASVKVTNATDRTLEIRILTSAGNSSDAFDLRCQVREHLVTFIQTHYPACLPQVRISSDDPRGSMSQPAPFKP